MSRLSALALRARFESRDPPPRPPPHRPDGASERTQHPIYSRTGLYAAVGLYVINYGGGSLAIRDSTFEGKGGASTGVGVVIDSVAIPVELMNVRASGTSDGVVTLLNAGQPVRATACVFEGPQHSVNIGGGSYDIRLAGGQLIGSVSGTGPRCALVSNGTFDPLQANCLP